MVAENTHSLILLRSRNSVPGSTSAGGPRIQPPTSCGMGTQGHNWPQGTRPQAFSLRKAGAPSSIPVTGIDLPPQNLAIHRWFSLFTGWELHFCPGLSSSFPASFSFLCLYLSFSLFLSLQLFIHFCFLLIYWASFWSIGFHSWFLSYSGEPPDMRVTG